MLPKIGYNLVGIKEEGFWIREPKIDLEATDQEIHFGLTNRLNADEGDHAIEVASIVMAAYKEEDSVSGKRPPLLNYEAVFRFAISGMDFTSQPDEEEGYEYIQFPPGFLATLIGLAYSTCRGILFARTAGSQLHNYLLPTTDPAAFASDLHDRLRRKIAKDTASAEKSVISKAKPSKQKA